MTEETAGKIRAERTRQVEKWGEPHLRGMRQERILAVLMEEVGEVARALLEFRDASIEGAAALEAEVIQVAAEAAAWLDECFSGENGSSNASEPTPAPQRARHDPEDEAGRDNPDDPLCQWPDCPRRVPAAQERLSQEHFGKTLCPNHEVQLAVVRSKKTAKAA